MKKMTMVEESFLIDDETNAIMLVWPDIHKEKIFWRDLLRIYYEIINIIISNDICLIEPEPLMSSIEASLPSSKLLVPPCALRR